MSGTEQQGLNIETQGTETPAAAETQTPQTTTEVTVTPTEPVSRRDAIKAALESAPERKGRDRAADGKFAKAGESIPVAAQPSTQAAPVKKERKYPSSYKPEYKPLFDELAGNEKYMPILDEIERRETEYGKGLEPYKESANFAQAIRKVIQPYEQTMRALNVTPEVAVEKLLQADAILRHSPPEQKQAYLMQLAQEYGIQIAGPDGEPQQVDPYVQALWQQQQQTNQVLQQFMTAQQQSEMASATKSVEEFKKTHEFMEEVRAEMADLIDKGLAKGLDDAYDRAIWSNPAIRGRVLAKQQTDTEAKRKEDARKTTAAAKSAAVQIKGAPSTGNDAIRQVSGKTRREVIASMVDRGV